MARHRRSCAPPPLLDPRVAWPGVPAMTRSQPRFPVGPCGMILAARRAGRPPCPRRIPCASTPRPRAATRRRRGSARCAPPPASPAPQPAPCSPPARRTSPGGRRARRGAAGGLGTCVRGGSSSSGGGGGGSSAAAAATAQRRQRAGRVEARRCGAGRLGRAVAGAARRRPPHLMHVLHDQLHEHDEERQRDEDPVTHGAVEHQHVGLRHGGAPQWAAAALRKLERQHGRCSPIWRCPDR
jgi:hypothetical protein